jgi:tRNA (guanine37-N1)-methyltransferase
MKFPKSFDFLGNVILIKFPREFKKSDKKKFAQKLLEKNKSVETILEKTDKFKGRLRISKTKWLAGKKTKEVLYKENNCVFRFNIDTTYFSPRLSNERKEIAGKIKKGEKVLVMFAGISVFPIVIAKNSKAKEIYSNEINREANKYGKMNVELNKVKDRVQLVPGDIKRVAEKLNKKFDVIVMPRPQLKDCFLKQAFNLSKKGTRIFYYDFCGVDKVSQIVEKVKKEALIAKKKIKIIKTKKAGEIAPYKIRLRIDFQVV